MTWRRSSVHISRVEVAHFTGADVCSPDRKAGLTPVDPVDIDKVGKGPCERGRIVVGRGIGSEWHVRTEEGRCIRPKERRDPVGDRHEIARCLSHEGPSADKLHPGVVLHTTPELLQPR